MNPAVESPDRSMHYLDSSLRHSEDPALVRVADEGLSVMDPALRQAAYNKMYRGPGRNTIPFLLFGAILQWLPTFGRGGPSHFVLPAFLPAWSIMAGLMRLGRSSMLEVLDSEFIKFARVKGLTESLAIWKHALRNALIPLIPSAG